MDQRRKKRRVENEEKRAKVDPSPGVPDLVNLGVNRRGIPSNIPSRDGKSDATTNIYFVYL